MKITPFMILVLMLQSCQLGKYLHQKDRVDKTEIRYHLVYNNRRPSHQPDVIYAVAFNFENKMREFDYNYYVKTGILKKYKIYKNRISEMYFLCDDKNNIAFNSTFLKLTSLDSTVIKKIKYCIDSLHYKHFTSLDGTSFKKIDSLKY